MAQSGFIILAKAAGDKIANEPLLEITRDFTNVNNNGGVELVVAAGDTAGVNVTDIIYFQDDGSTNYPRQAATVTAVTSTTITTGATFVADDTGTFSFEDPLPFGDNTQTNNNLGTPRDVMREIQVQFLTGSIGSLSVTFDNGMNYFPVNDNNTINGLATFTIFVDDSTTLNFRFSVDASIVITVGG